MISPDTFPQSDHKMGTVSRHTKQMLAAVVAARYLTISIAVPPKADCCCSSASTIAQ
jgi:hypothetical protein